LRQGLRVIKKVVELQGLKKLKVNHNTRNTVINNAKQASNADIEEARKTFRMMNNTTHYATSYGMSPQKQADSEILNYKGFHQLSIVQILKPEVLRVLDHWLKINDVDEFKRRIYTTIRDMYTIIKN
jgi:hypothetical protein